MEKKAQAWGFDITIAAIIFTLAVITFYLFSLNYSGEAEESLGALEYDANTIANALLSEGYPAQWSSENVIKIGLLSDSRINETKLLSFKELSLSDYPKTKSIFNTLHNYEITFSENMTIESTTITSIGLSPSSPQNLIKVTRLATYDNKPLVIYINVWE